MMLKPMLAPSKVITQQQFEDGQKKGVYWLESIKMDGVRCLVSTEGPYTRNGKEIPNRTLRTRLNDLAHQLRLHYASTGQELVLDGELWSSTLPFQKISGAVRAFERGVPPELQYNVFDCIDVNHLDEIFDKRYRRLNSFAATHSWQLCFNKFARVVGQALSPYWDTLQEHFTNLLSAGYEGLIIRNSYGKYKQGRCTPNEYNMYKLKAVETRDGKIIALQPLHRSLDRETDAFGYSKTLRDQGNVYLTDLLGSFLVEMEDGTQVSVGSGFTDTQRKQFNDERFIGRWIEFKYLKAGTVDRPRFPVFVRLRDSKEEE